MPDEKESTVPNQTGKKSRRWILILALLILVIILSVAGMGIYQSTTEQASRTTTATAQTNQTTTATAQANAQHNAYISALSANGTIAFSDPLNKESGSQWHAESDETTCTFERNAYHIKPQGTYFTECDAPGTYNNFAFEVEVTILQGDCAGVVFRSNEQGKFYYFSIYQDGKYDIARYADYGLFEQLLPYGHSPAIHTGLGQTNKLAVKAQGSTLTFYINEQQIQQLDDKGYSAGSIGLAAYPNIGNAADAAYTNATLWTLPA